MYQYPSPKYNIANNIIDIDLSSKESILSALDFMLAAVEDYDSLERHTLKKIGWRDEDGFSFHYRNPTDGSFYDPNIQRQFADPSDGKISKYYQGLLDEDRIYVSNESDIVRELVKHPYAYEKLYQYVERLSLLHSQSAIDNDYSGACCALALALQHADAIPLLAEYWRNSETHHSSIKSFDELIKAHGLTLEILTMIFDHMMVCEFTPNPQQHMMSSLRKYEEYRDIETNQHELWFKAFDTALALPPIKHMAYVIPKVRDKLCVLFLELTMENMRNEFEQRANVYPIIPQYLAHYDQVQSLDLQPNQVQFSLDNSQEEEISNTLDRMIAITKSKSAFDAMQNEGDDEIFEWSFGKKDENGDFQTYDDQYTTEEQFFRNASEFPSLHTKLFEYAQQITKYMEENGEPLYSNEARYAGDWVWFFLCLRDKKYINYYTRYLRINSSSDGVFREQHIGNIALQYGITEETLYLIAAQLQIGGFEPEPEDIKQDLGLAKHFKAHPGDLDIFCKALVENANLGFGRPSNYMDDHIWEVIFGQDEQSTTSAHAKILSYLKGPIAALRDQSLSFDNVIVCDSDVQGPDKIVPPFEYPKEECLPLIQQDCTSIFEDAPGLKIFWEFDGDITGTDIDTGTNYFWFSYYENNKNALMGVDLKNPKKIKKEIPLSFYVSELSVNNGIAVMATGDSGDDSARLIALHLKSGKELYSKKLESDVSHLSIHPTRPEVAMSLDGFDPEDPDEDYDDFEDEINKLYILNLETGETLHSIEKNGYDYKFDDLMYSADGRWLCTAFQENSYIWDASNLTLKNKVRIPGVLAGDFSDQRFSILYRSKIAQYSYDEGRNLNSFDVPKSLDRFYRMGCHLPGNRMVVSDGYNDEDNMLDFFDLASSRLITTITMSGYDFKSIHFDTKTQSLILVTREGELIIWNWEAIGQAFTKALAKET